MATETPVLPMYTSSSAGAVASERAASKSRDLQRLRELLSPLALHLELAEAEVEELVKYVSGGGPGSPGGPAGTAPPRQSVTALPSSKSAVVRHIPAAAAGRLGHIVGESLALGVWAFLCVMELSMEERDLGWRTLHSEDERGTAGVVALVVMLVALIAFGVERAGVLNRLDVRWPRLAYLRTFLPQLVLLAGGVAWMAYQAVSERDLEAWIGFFVVFCVASMVTLQVIFTAPFAATAHDVAIGGAKARTSPNAVRFDLGPNDSESSNMLGPGDDAPPGMTSRGSVYGMPMPGRSCRKWRPLFHDPTFVGLYPKTEKLGKRTSMMAWTESGPADAMQARNSTGRQSSSQLEPVFGARRLGNDDIVIEPPDSVPLSGSTHAFESCGASESMQSVQSGGRLPVRTDRGHRLSSKASENSAFSDISRVTCRQDGAAVHPVSNAQSEEASWSVSQFTSQALGRKLSVPAPAYGSMDSHGSALSDVS